MMLLNEYFSLLSGEVFMRKMGSKTKKDVLKTETQENGRSAGKDYGSSQTYQFQSSYGFIELSDDYF